MIARKVLWRVMEKREILKMYVKTVRNMYIVFQKCVWKNGKVYCKTWYSPEIAIESVFVFVYYEKVYKIKHLSVCCFQMM